MTCERWQERYLDSLTEPLDPDSAVALGAHVATCPECGPWAEGMAAMWDDLMTLRAPTLPEASAERMAAALAPSRTGMRARAATPVAQAAGLVLAFVAGGGLAFVLTSGPGRDMPAEALPLEVATSADPSLATWLLLLHEPADAPLVATGSPEEAEAIREYGAWAGGLAREGRLVSAEKLDGDPGSWLPGPGPDASTTVSGFFLIRAASRAEAEEIASASPHVRRGGTVEVRRIDPT